MDILTKKLILQFDDPAPGQRGNAFAMACEHLAKSGQTWRGIAEDIERADEAAGLRQDNAKLAAELTKTSTELEQHKAAISQWDRAYKMQGAKLAVANAVAWGRTTGRWVAFCIALPVIALLGWQVYERYVWPAAVDEGLRRIAASEPWHDGFDQPAVYRIGNDIYWVLTYGDTDTSDHTTARGGPVGMHCIHVYAHPAQADFGQYVKADPWLLWHFWLKWPQRAVQCTSFPLQEAQR